MKSRQEICFVKMKTFKCLCEIIGEKKCAQCLFGGDEKIVKK